MPERRFEAREGRDRSCENMCDGGRAASFGLLGPGRRGSKETRRQGGMEGWRDGEGGAASDRKQIQTDVSECGSAACESVSVFVCVGRTTHTTRDQAGGESV